MFRKKKGWLWVIRQSEFAPMEKIIIAQSQHETANWKSSLFKNHNSLFGMKWPVDLPGTHQGPISPEGDYYTSYDAWENSAQHLLHWLRRKKIPVTTDVSDYVKSIRNAGFFTDTFDNYLNGVNRFL